MTGKQPGDSEFSTGAATEQLSEKGTPSEIVEGFRVIQKLGEGGMGELYETWGRTEKEAAQRALLPTTD